MAILSKSIQQKFSESEFLAFIGRRAGAMGCELLCLAFRLFYALKSPNTPKWAKRTIIGALIYLISPIDAIPDFIPILGFSDDLVTLTAAALALNSHIDQEARQKAHDAVKRFVGRCDCEKTEKTKS